MGIFTTVFTQPIFNFVVWLYDTLPGNDLGVAIILLTIAAKLLLLPFSAQALRSQRALQDLQPKIQELREKHKGKDQEQELARATLAMYRQEKVSPFSSLLPVLVQLPILISLYRALRNILNSRLDLLYPFIPNPGTIHPFFLGFVNLATPSLALALLAALAQYGQAKMMPVTPPPRAVAGKPGSKDEGSLAAMNKQMRYMMPAFTFFISASLPAGLALYWLMTNLLAILQQHYVLHEKDRMSLKARLRGLFRLFPESRKKI